MSEVLLAGIDLTRHYPAAEVEALRGVTLEVRAGESVAIMGPSGSGKSTLLSLLGALDTPTSGEVRILGKSVTARADRAEVRSKHLGFVFQSHHMIPALTLRENVEIPLHARGTPAAERRIAAAAALEAVGLAHRVDHAPTRVSGGERQRAAVARALVTNPQIILADEPTGSVDHLIGTQVLELLMTPVRERGAALIVVTHDPEVAAECDRTLRLRDGRLETD
ncbi:MAG: ABC transporter ATP-binding protein [Planctomycetota bacterium]|jgi:predicted ABC-type transport system involved in lysophospholipase L1 biosynthesis ATPase subunit